METNESNEGQSTGPAAADDNSEKPTGHAKKELRRQEEEKRRREGATLIKSAQQKKAIIKYGIIAVVLIGLVAGGYWIAQLLPKGTGTYTPGPVHWHASLEIVTCGQTRDLPRPLPGQHLGTGILHTHEDQLIHIEGVIPNEEAIMLKRYMDNIGLHFKNNEILDYQNGALCNGKPGSVKLLANGEENNLLGDYVLKDGDKLRIEFG